MWDDFHIQWKKKLVEISMVQRDLIFVVIVCLYILYYILLYFIVLYYVILCYVILCYVMFFLAAL
jgi:hypothetical protein